MKDLPYSEVDRGQVVLLAIVITRSLGIFAMKIQIKVLLEITASSMRQNVRKTVLQSGKRTEKVPLSEPSKGVFVHAVVSSRLTLYVLVLCCSGFTLELDCPR